MRETLFCFESSSKGGKDISKRENKDMDLFSTRVRNIAKEKGASVNVVYLRYFFDCFLRWLPASSYVDKFVL